MKERKNWIDVKEKHEGMQSHCYICQAVNFIVSSVNNSRGCPRDFYLTEYLYQSMKSLFLLSHVDACAAEPSLIHSDTIQMWGYWKSDDIIRAKEKPLHTDQSLVA